MKYDRPVWQIMHRCADEMPATFRFEDVHAWFGVHYPEVNAATIRAHLIGLTEGGRAKHVQFASRSPVFRRVMRGQYEAIAAAERGEHPDSTSSSRSTESALTASADTSGSGDIGVPDVILLGSLGARVSVPAPAKDMFRDASFQLSRLDAELGESQWFILSAEHGLLAPHEWISPDPRTLADLDAEFRASWASWVVARLQALIGSVAGLHVRVDGPEALLGPLLSDLRAAGAVVASGEVAGDSTSERSASGHPAHIVVADRHDEKVSQSS